MGPFKRGQELVQDQTWACGPRSDTGDRSQLQLLISRTDPWPPAVTETPHSLPPNCCTGFNSQSHKTGLQLSSPSLGAGAASSALAAASIRLTGFFPPTDEARCVSGERGPRRAGGRESLSPGAQGRQDTRGGPRRARVGAFQVGPADSWVFARSPGCPFSTASAPDATWVGS